MRIVPSTSSESSFDDILIKYKNTEKSVDEIAIPQDNKLPIFMRFIVNTLLLQTQQLKTLKKLHLEQDGKFAVQRQIMVKQ